MSKRAEELCSGVHVLHDEALELAESVLFMAKKLKIARRQMVNEDPVIEYDNGGGQRGIRENPHYTAYEYLMTAYIKSLRQLSDILENVPEEKKPMGVMAELYSIAGRKIG
jgi:hypothetical protein